MAELKKKVERLTADQMQVLHHLRRERRVLVTGCAGSGKTLLVAEKAIRLDAAGMRTLILCHNPNLARHLTSLVANPAIDVLDIGAFVDRLAGIMRRREAEWTIYNEPLDEEIARASAAISSENSTYEAIIVDEGQDFRESWWHLVELALSHLLTRTLYIFCDDNQALLPHRSRYPITGAPISMSRNCRNGGNIFEIVRRFHREAPLTSSFLATDGVARVTPFRDQDFEQRLEAALVDACKHASLAHIRVLTSEPSAESSAINGFRFTRDPQQDWRTVVDADLNALRVVALKRIRKLQSGNSYSEITGRFGIPLQTNLEDYLSVPALSRSALPIDNDVNVVRTFAARLCPFFEGDRSNVARVRFTIQKHQLHLSSESHTGKPIPVNNASKAQYYATPNWHSSLEPAPRTTVAAGDTHEADSIRFQSVDAFKGLEGDAIILVVMSASHNLMRELYVGASRAVCYLNLVIARPVLAVLSSLDDLNNEFLVP